MSRLATAIFGARAADDEDEDEDADGVVAALLGSRGVKAKSGGFSRI